MEVALRALDRLPGSNATRDDTEGPKDVVEGTAVLGAIRHDLPIQFGHEQLTSYGGLELVRRYFHLIGLNARIRCALGKHVRGDYGGSHLVLLVIGLLVVGARRLQHLRYLANDSLFARFCGLPRIPSDRMVVNWLKQFTQTSRGALMRLNSELLYERIEQLNLRRLMIDRDGTVIRTGGKVGWALHGFNPHHPKNPSYYPLLAHLAQTGQILRLKNRPGNVHGSQGAERFVRELIGEVRARLGRALTLEFRMDAAFFQQNLFKLLTRLGCFYAVKVPLCRWTGVKALIAGQTRWTVVAGDIDGSDVEMWRGGFGAASRSGRRPANRPAGSTSWSTCSINCPCCYSPARNAPCTR